MTHDGILTHQWGINAVGGSPSGHLGRIDTKAYWCTSEQVLTDIHDGIGKFIVAKRGRDRKAGERVVDEVDVVVGDRGRKRYGEGKGRESIVGEVEGFEGG